MSDIDFTPWPKTPRLFREVIITEKIDGTNAAVGILEDGRVYAQSRKRIITPDDDNFGFARWVNDNAGTLVDDLGVGLHFGEWWGSGIQRGYGLTRGDKRFSLFNVARWRKQAEPFYTPNLDLVPVLYQGVFSEHELNVELQLLKTHGSFAAPHFMNPEGVVMFHAQSRQVYKVLIENDELPKSAAA